MKISEKNQNQIERMNLIKNKCNQMIFNMFRKHNKKRFEHSFENPSLIKNQKIEINNNVLSKKFVHTLSINKKTFKRIKKNPNNEIQQNSLFELFSY
jgi:hypothetical protein